MESGKSTLVALLLITGLVQSATATSYTVGDSTGWTIPSTSTFYDDWAASKTFVVGDQLVFNYAAQQHSVLEVTQADLSSCNLNNPLVSHQNSGGVTITLTATGFHGFICGVPTHCSSNMKMSLTVTGQATPPADAPVPPPQVAPVSPPTAAPVSPPTPAPVSPPTAAPVSPPTSAPVSPPTPAPASPPTKAPVPTPSKTPSPVPSSKSPAPAPAKKLSPPPSSSVGVPPAFAPGPSSTTTGSASVLRSGSTVIVGAVIAAAAAGVLMF